MKYPHDSTAAKIGLWLWWALLLALAGVFVLFLWTEDLREACLTALYDGATLVSDFAGNVIWKK